MSLFLPTTPYPNPYYFFSQCPYPIPNPTFLPLTLRPYPAALSLTLWPYHLCTLRPYPYLYLRHSPCSISSLIHLLTLASTSGLSPLCLYSLFSSSLYSLSSSSLSTLFHQAVLSLYLMSPLSVPATPSSPSAIFLSTNLLHTLPTLFPLLPILNTLYPLSPSVRMSSPSFPLKILEESG